MKPLSGVTVVDLSLFLPGPVMTRLMADAGARVIKVEPPAGDPAWEMGPFEGGTSIWAHNVNAGKERVLLDLKTEDGKAELWRLIESADILVEAFRPGAMKRLGFDYETVAAAKADIIYCSLSAFGQTGPLADHPAHDMAVQALSGFLAINDGPDGRPVVPGAPTADMAVGLTGLAAVSMALHGRTSTGRGCYIDCAMFDSLLPWTSHLIGPVFADGTAPASATQRSLGGAAFYNVYETKDGRFVVLAGREMKFVRNLLDALGRPDLAPLGNGPPGPPQAPLKTFLADTFRTRTRDEWVDWFHDKDVAFAPVVDLAEMTRHPIVKERGLIFVDGDGRHTIQSPLRFTGR